MTAPTTAAALDRPLGSALGPLHALWQLTLGDRVSHQEQCPDCTDPPFVLCPEGMRHMRAEQAAHRAYRADRPGGI